ncbi:MAG TPA: tRNA (adenosine(37)-N6)-dimethylallyltransferase MiaA [Actinomycetota bacterium]|nr:tRNA (adenosine(37)-N6)-dimethylallyltransferase MiaA [Actinomycetota bacterium]
MAPRSRPPFALVGSTASGKTEAALPIAERLGAEICSVDSMLVYRGMDIGTAKPTDAERARVPHHLLDLAEPSERFTVARFQQHARAVLGDLGTRGVPALLVGGSGLYFRAVVDDLEFPAEDEAVRDALQAEVASVGPGPLHARLRDVDPVAAARIEPGNVRRTVRALEVAASTGRPFSSYAGAWERYPRERAVAAGVRMPSDVLARRIASRVRSMIERGWLDEVRTLLERGFGGWLTATQAIGYAELAAHLDGRLSLDEAVEATVKRTKNLARRQMAWFRRDPRIRWFDAGEGGAIEVADDVTSFLERGAPA